jgi:hypothetical protein
VIGSAAVVALHIAADSLHVSSCVALQPEFDYRWDSVSVMRSMRAAAASAAAASRVSHSLNTVTKKYYIIINR